MYPIVICLSTTLLFLLLSSANQLVSKAHCIDNKINSKLNRAINKVSKFKGYKVPKFPNCNGLAQVKIGFKGNIDNE